MKIAIISDTHLGYARFEEDSLKQAAAAFEDADKKADVIIYAGDVFDTKIPKLETIKKAIEILKQVKKPIFAIFGNHERRSRDLTNPVQLIAATGLLKLLHGTQEIFEYKGEKIQIFGLGSIPEELAETALKQVMGKFIPEQNAFKILVLHQSIRELIPNATHEISLEYLRELPFDLVINGHIHERIIKLEGKFIIPGSTVVTQLKKEETASRGYELYDTSSKIHEFVPIACRKFFYEEMKFDNAPMSEVKEIIEKKVLELKRIDDSAIIRIKASGTLREGVNRSDFSVGSYENTFIDLHFDNHNL
ncbi:MAG: DNA repair exonuclease, partial [Candidatus Micrarchaeota archaeon]|nr:DNA repair exonuclease [Candidatus Micrarchaeota archaeon]